MKYLKRYNESIESEKRFVVDKEHPSLKYGKFKLFLGDTLVSESGFTIEEPDEYFSQQYATLYSLKTFEKFQRKGFAKYLLEQIFNYVKNELKLNFITLNVDKKNNNAIELYFNIGFEIFISYDNAYTLVKPLYK